MQCCLTFYHFHAWRSMVLKLTVAELGRYSPFSIDVHLLVILPRSVFHQRGTAAVLELGVERIFRIQIHIVQHNDALRSPCVPGKKVKGKYQTAPVFFITPLCWWLLINDPDDPKWLFCLCLFKKIKNKDNPFRPCSSVGICLLWISQQRLPLSLLIYTLAAPSALLPIHQLQWEDSPLRVNFMPIYGQRMWRSPVLSKNPSPPPRLERWRLTLQQVAINAERRSCPH